MPLSLKATVTRRQPADDPPADNAHQTAKDTATAVEPAPPLPKAKPDAHALQSAFLSANLGKVVTLFVINGIRLTGKLRQFDQYTLLLEDAAGQKSLVFKHALSTVCPGSPRRRPDGEE